MKPKFCLFRAWFRLTVSGIQFVAPAFCIAWFLFEIMRPCCLASDFVFEKVELKGDIYSVIDFPLEFYWPLAGDRPEFTVQNSESPTGYTATWLIESDGLYLCSIKGIRQGREISARDFFESDVPVLATWFTGTIQLVKGRVGSGCVAKRYSDVLVMSIENGLVKRSRTSKDHEIVWPGRIGVTLKKVDGRVIVNSITPGSPAQHSNRIQVGDEFITITSEDWGEKQLAIEELPTINGFIRGLSGTKIQIGRKRIGLEIESITLERTFAFDGRDNRNPK